MSRLADDPSVVQRIFDHIDNRSTDRGESSWREPVKHYRSEPRHRRELDKVLRRSSTPFCPSAALREPGAYVARTAAGVPLIAVRGKDMTVRVFRNACRHRGMQLADGSGCKRAFVCPYHAWTYDLDGRLRGVPHEDGFPGLDKGTHGLVPVDAVEMHGLVFVTQHGPAPAAAALDELTGIVGPGHRLVSTSELEIAANWKIVAEGFMEGYHLNALHTDTFFAIQYDNLNVIERFGENSRITFPYRRIEGLRDVPAAERSARGVLTYVYHLFPNAMLITFATNVTLAVVEPVGVDHSRLVSYVLTQRDLSQPAERDTFERDLRFIASGTAQDRDAAIAIQRGLAAEANEFFEFGRFEGAIVHFHRNLRARLGEAAG